MSNRELKVEQSEDNGKTKLSFSGSIDEDFKFDTISIDKDDVIVDFEEITLLNSCGIREWIKFVTSLGGSKKITYVNCPSVVVMQMNMVKGFLSENAQVESFYAPYYDEDLDEEVKILIKSADVVDGKAPEVKSDSGKPLEFDGIEKTYFKFLA